MGDFQRRQKENVGSNAGITHHDSGKSYQGTPKKQRGDVHLSSSQAFPTTPQRSASGASGSHNSVASQKMAGTPISSKYVPQQATPVPTSRTVSHVPSRAESNTQASKSSSRATEEAFAEYSEPVEVEYEPSAHAKSNDEEEPMDAANARELTNEEYEEIVIEPSDLIRAEDEDWMHWEHEELAEHASLTNMALLQLAEDIVQWRVAFAKLDKDRKYHYDAYVQQCHRLLRKSSALKQCVREKHELAEEIAQKDQHLLAVEQRLVTQQDRFKSNLDALHMLKTHLADAHKRIKDMESGAEDFETQLHSRESALEETLQTAQALSKNLNAANARIAQLEMEKEEMKETINGAQEKFDLERRAFEEKVEALTKENAEYAKQIDNLAETPAVDGVSVSSSAHMPALNAVPETPSKRTWSAAGNASRVEALSIRVETLRAHNTTLEETLSRQEKAAKMQMEMAAAEEMKLRREAKQLQQKVDVLDAELDAAQLVTESLKEELSDVQSKLQASSSAASSLNYAEKKIQALEQQVESLEKEKIADKLSLENALKFEIEAKSLQSQLDNATQEIEELRSAHAQSEDDMRLLYLQHKQEKTELEQTYRHADYKARYADAVNRASVLHQKLSHVLQFIATNQVLAKLAAETTDNSSKETLSGAWMTDFSETAPSSTSRMNVVQTPSKAVSRMIALTPRKVSIASSSPFSSPAAPQKRNAISTPLSKRISMVNAAASAPSPALNSNGSPMQETSQLAATLIESCKEWKSKCESLADHVVALETLLSRERKERLEQVQHVSQEASESLQNNMEAIQISHDAQIGRYETELQTQTTTLEAQTEAYRSLHMAYVHVVEECNALKMHLHNAASDLITYRAVYEEAKAVTQASFEATKSGLESELVSVGEAMNELKERLERQISDLLAEVCEKEETLAFMETEAKAGAEAEAEARETLIDEYTSQVTALEVRVETQQLHMEVQETLVKDLSAKLEVLEKAHASASQELANEKELREKQSLVLCLALQRAEKALEEERTQVEEAREAMEKMEEERCELSDSLEVTEVLLGRAKGTLIGQSLKMRSVQYQLDSARCASEEWMAKHEVLAHEFGAFKSEREALVSSLEGNVKALEAQNEEHVQSRNAMQADWERERAQMSQTAAENRVALVSTLSRMEQVALDLSDTQTQLAAVQDEAERVKAQLEEENEENAKLRVALEEHVLIALEKDNAVKQSEAYREELEKRLSELKEKMDVSVSELQLVSESALRECVAQRNESDRLLNELEQAQREVEKWKQEQEKSAVELERKVVELDLSTQSLSTLSSSRNQMEEVVKKLESSQNESQVANTELQKMLEFERDQVNKQLAKVESLLETISSQALQISHLQQQVNLSSSSSSLPAPQNPLATSTSNLNSSNGTQQYGAEVEGMFREHHEWLVQVKSALLSASKQYLSDVTVKRVEMDEESASLRATIMQLECALLERERERDELVEKVARFTEDLALAKNSHRTLILQNGMLSSLIMLANSANASTATGTAGAGGKSIEVIAKEHGFVSDMNEMMKMQRQCQALLLKLQHVEDNCKKLESQLSETKETFYEKEGTWIAQIKAYKQRNSKTEEQIKSLEQSKLQLFTFLTQIRETLVRTVQVPTVRELLRQWAPLMNSLVQSNLKQYETEETATAAPSTGSATNAWR